MASHDQSRFAPDVDDVIEAYLGSVRTAMSGLDDDIIAETIEDLRAHMTEELGPTSTRADAEALVRRLGSTDAAVIGTAVDDPDGIDVEADAAGTAPRGAKTHGRLLGMPYDVRVPTSERVAQRWWNPGDPRIWMPRAFGLGWDINLGAVAVRLHLIEPDAEESPFSAVPQYAFVAAVAVPTVLTGALLASYLWLLPELPAQLPTHWGITGAPDGWSPRGWAFGVLLALAAGPTALALHGVVTRQPALNRGVRIGFAGLFSALAASLWALTLATTLAGFSAAWLPVVAILGALLVPAALLVVLARIGRAVEIRNDLGRNRP